MKRDELPHWLVKSSGRIIGPFSKAEVSKLLLSNEIVGLDEICEPMRRWQMIREHPEYLQVLNDMKTQTIGGSGDTEISGTQTSSFTQSLTEDEYEITEDISEFQKQLKEIVVEDSSLSGSAAVRATAGRYQVARQIDNSRMKDEAEGNSRWLWLVTLIVLAVVGATLYWKEFRKGGFGRMSSGEILQEASAKYAVGDYESALELYKKVAEQQSFRKDLPLPYGLLLLQIEGRTREARDWLKKEPTKDGKASLESLTGLAVADLVDGDPKGAERILSEVLERDPRNVPALINLGATAIMQRDYVRAKDYFDSAIAVAGNHPVALIQLVEVYSAQMRRSQKVNLKSIERRISEAYSGAYNFKQELGLARIYLRTIGGDKSNLEDSIRQILDIDPAQTADHRADLLLFKGYSDWFHLYSWCEQVVNAAGETASSKALLAYCQFKQGRILQARQALDQAINMSPKDPLIQSIYSLVLSHAGLKSEASVALGRAVEVDRKAEYLLPTLLQAKFCLERKDMECAREGFIKSLSKDSRSLSARAGLAQIFLRKGMEKEAKRNLNEIEQVAKDYKPLLRLARPGGHS